MNNLGKYINNSLKLRNDLLHVPKFKYFFNSSVPFAHVWNMYCFYMNTDGL